MSQIDAQTDGCSSPDSTLYLIDGHAQMFRAFYAIRSPMTSPVTGEPTNAVFAFTGMLLKLFENFKPTHAALAIDSKGDTFRHALYPEYKGTRDAPPEEFVQQIPVMLEIAELFGLKIYAQPGAEADDIMATFAVRLADDFGRIRLVSKDKDLQQCLTEKVTLFDIHKDEEMDLQGLMAKKGVRPDQIIDLQVLTGDNVDNIPGVAGIGDKTAAKLIGEFGSVENLLANLDQIKGKRRENIEAGREHFELTRQLVTLKTDVDLPATADEMKLGVPDAQVLAKRFKELGFNRYQKDAHRLFGDEANAGAGTGAGAGANGGGGGGGGGGGVVKQPPAAVGLFGAASEDTAHNAAHGAAHDAVVLKAKKTRVQKQKSAETDASAASTGMGGLGGLFANMDEDGNGGGGGGGGDVFELIGPQVHPPEGCVYESVTTQEQLDLVVKTLADVKVFAVDTETLGLGSQTGLCGICLAWKDNHGIYIPTHLPTYSDGSTPAYLDEQTVIAALKPLLEDTNIIKVGHNLKYDIQVLERAGTQVLGPIYDTMIAAFLAGQPGLKMDDLALALLGRDTIRITQLIGEKKRGQTQRSMGQIPLEYITPYAAEDADITLRLYNYFEPLVREMGMDELAQKIEMPLVQVLSDMETAGVCVDAEILKQQQKGMEKRIATLQDQVIEAAGVTFNLDSPKQLGDVLFNQLGFKPVKKTKTGYSTNSEVLEKLVEDDGHSLALTRAEARSIPADILEYRMLTKLMGTYLQALQDAIAEDGRVHCRFHQTGAATGRLSSSDPNLQNIPIRTEQGRLVRKAFVAKPGYVLLCADYSQIELRMLAHLSEDQALIDAFEHGADIHTAVAAQTFDVKPDEVTSDQRSAAKMVNFGIVYGITAFGLSRRLGGDFGVGDAQAIIDDYKTRFPGIDAFLDRCVQQALENGYVTTILGRRRNIEQVNSKNSNARALGERLAINSVVQGSAADLIKLAMVQLDHKIQAEQLPMRMLLQVHDELICEAKAEEADRMAGILTAQMEQAMSLKVPLIAEAGIGEDWFSAK